LSSFRRAADSQYDPTICQQEGHTREAVEVDGPQKVEELDAMLGELGEILVDHVQSALKDVLHDHGYLVLHKALIASVSHSQSFKSPSNIPKAW
jgi:hypothetical protein